MAGEHGRRGIGAWLARHPWWSIVLALVIVSGLAAGGQPPMSNDGEDLAPGAPALRAAAQIDELFPDRASTSALQVLVEVDGDGGVLGPDGVTALQAVRDLAEDSFGDQLSDPGVLTPLDPLLAPPSGASPGDLPDDPAALQAAWRAALDRLPPQAAGRLTGLLPTDVAPGAATQALVLVLITEGEDSARLIDAEAAFATDLGAAAAAGELGAATASAFSPNLVSAQELGSEILTLLGVAVLVILAILVVLFFPRGQMSWLRRARRAVADGFTAVLVALCTVQAANGFAAWLGPDNLGWIGAQTGPSNAVPILLIGLAVDYVIHYNREYRDDLHSGTAPQPSTAIALTGVRRALVLSSVTTILGFLTNTLSGIAGLRDFGIVAAFGIAMALLFTYLLFPAVRQLLDRLAARRAVDLAAQLEPDRDGRLAAAVGGLARLTARPRAVLAAAVVITVGAGVASTGLSVEFSFLDFVPTDSPLRETAQRLEEDFDGGGEQVRILVEGDITDPAVHNALLDADRNLDDVATLQAAGDRAQVTSPIRALGALAAGPGADQAVATVVAAELDDELRAGDGSDLTAVWEAAAAADPAIAARVRLAAEPATVVEAVAGDIADAGAFGDALDQAFLPVEQAGAEAAATSLSLNDAAVVNRLSAIQVQSLVLAVLAALLVLVTAFWLSDRRPLIGAVTVVPVALSVVVLFGVMAVVGIPFTPVTATLAALAVGIGVDYAIHLAARYGRERRAGNDGATAVREALTTTGSALTGSGLTTAAGFAVLTASTLVPFQQLGTVTLIGIVTAVVATTMVLPSLLLLADRGRWEADDVAQEAAERQLVSG